MNSIPEEIKILRLINIELNRIMNDRYTAVEIRSTELYDHLKKNLELIEIFHTPRLFNQFLRKHHDSGIMKQVIPNYRADTSNPKFYQWFFRKDIKYNMPHAITQSEAIVSKYKFFKSTKNVIAVDGQKLRSIQEKFIYEELLKCYNLTIFYDHPISKLGEIKYADFKVRNNLNHTEFVWEHFGMTNNEDYKDHIPEILKWYTINGFKTIEKGGSLIYTYYSDEKTFNRDVLMFIEQIKTTFPN